MAKHRVGQLLRSPVFWFKLIEWVLVLSIIVLTMLGGFTCSSQLWSELSATSRCYVVFGTPLAWLALNTLAVLACCKGQGLSKINLVLTNLGGGGMFMATGTLFLFDFGAGFEGEHVSSVYSLVSGILSIILSAIYLVDLAVVCCCYRPPLNRESGCAQ